MRGHEIECQSASCLWTGVAATVDDLALSTSCTCGAVLLIVTEFVSQHLAAGITRDRGDDGDVPRLFEARHPVLQILPQSGIVDVGARTGDDEGREPLAEVL